MEADIRLVIFKDDTLQFRKVEDAMHPSGGNIHIICPKMQISFRDSDEMKSLQIRKAKKDSVKEFG